MSRQRNQIGLPVHVHSMDGQTDRIALPPIKLSDIHIEKEAKHV